MHSNKNKSKLHIAMIGQKRVPSREGGVEVVVWELASRLRDKGHVVDCYNRYQKHKQPREKVAGKPGLYCDDIRIIVVPTLNNGKLNAIVYAFFATIRALFGGYDVIHYHAEGPCLMLWLPKLFGKRVIATIHGLDWQRAKWGNFASKMLMTGEKIAAKYADEVIVFSKNVQDYFKKTYGRDTNYIPNGISRPVIRKPDLITEKYGLKGDDYIMTLCRIVPEKGIHYLLEAYKTIDSDMKIVVAGGFSNAAEYMEQIKQMAAEDPRVILTDFIHDQELEELCSNAYIFCTPSDVEGMSISLLEGMSYGRCCLVSDIDENLEVVEDKAVSFKKSDVDDLRDKVRFLIDHPGVVEEYKAASADFICDKYNWSKMTDATIALYNR